MAEGEEETAAAVEEEADEYRAVRTLRAPWTPQVGLSGGDLSASSGTPKVRSRTSGRQRYHTAANVLTVYPGSRWLSQPDVRTALFHLPVVVFRRGG